MAILPCQHLVGGCTMLESNTQPKGIDFNDLSIYEGLESVSSAIDHATRAIEPPKWPEPMIPGTLRTPDFPSDILQGAWGDMARAVSDSTQTPPALSIMCVLGVLATILQRRFEVKPHGLEDSYHEPLSLWVISASVSGTRKTAVLNTLMEPIVSWERMQNEQHRSTVSRVNAERSTSKKRIEEYNKQAAKCKEGDELENIRYKIQSEEMNMPNEVIFPRLFTGDTTAERLQNMLLENAERMAVHSDESGIFRIMAGAYSNGSQNLDVFLQGHAGSAMRIDRAGRAAHVDKPALSFNLMTQPGVMQDAAGSKGFRDSGLLARFMYAIPVSNVGKRDVRLRKRIPDEVREAYHKSVYSLLNGWLCEPGKVPNVRYLYLSDPAKELWLDFSQYIEDNNGDDGKFESIRDWASKLAGAVARIAAILELSEMGLCADTVSSDAMERAIKLAKVLIPHAKAAFGLLGTDVIDTDAQAIIKWIQTNERIEFTRSEAQKAMEGRFRTVDKLKLALERLASMDCVQECKRSNKGTKATVYYKVNPRLLK